MSFMGLLTWCVIFLLIAITDASTRRVAPNASGTCTLSHDVVVARGLTALAALRLVTSLVHLPRR
jgi:hypothetical protein